MKKTRWSGGGGGQRGATLVEALVSVALLGTAAAAFLSALSVSSRAVAIVEERAQAQRIAYSQLEKTRGDAFIPTPASYGTVTPPAGYGVTVEALPGPEPDANLQLIRVTVYREGLALLWVDDFKVNR